jgi:hypothetical protein
MHDPQSQRPQDRPDRRTATIGGHTWTLEFMPGMNVVQIDNDWIITTFVSVNPVRPLDKAPSGRTP